ncbi:MAG: nitroreductase family protein [Chitinophagaceae bacterium]|nr:nitroreductase family protein [Chitinophagaceae bacterium]
MNIPAEEPVISLIKERRSIRAFSNKEVEPEKITELFEAARWAPSAMNEQPWMYVYAGKGQQLHSDIVETLFPGNQSWAGKAPLLIVSIMRDTFINNGNPNNSALHDTGMANYAISLGAVSLGLHTHMMGGFHQEALKQKLNLSEGLHPVVVMAVGYAGSPDDLPEGLKHRELAARTRKPVSAFTFNQIL